MLLLDCMRFTKNIRKKTCCFINNRREIILKQQHQKKYINIFIKVQVIKLYLF